MKYLKFFEFFNDDPFEKQLDQDLSGQEEYQKIYYELDNLEEPLNKICQDLFKVPGIKFQKAEYSDSIYFTYKDRKYNINQYYTIITLIDESVESEENNDDNNDSEVGQWDSDFGNITGDTIISAIVDWAG